MTSAAAVTAYLEDLKNQLATKRQQHQQTSRKADDLFRDSEKLARAIREFQEKHSGKSGIDLAQLEEPERANWTELNARYDAAFAGANLARDRAEKLNEEIRELEEQLRFPPQVTITECEEAYAAVGEAAAKVDQIKALIADQEHMISNAQSEGLDLSAIQKEREDISAAITAGEKTREDLDNFERRVAEMDIQHRREHEDETRHAQAAIAGLRRRLEEAEAAWRDAVQVAKEVEVLYLKAAALASWRRYLKATDALNKQYSRLLGFDMLLQGKGEGNLRFGYGRPLSVPGFNLPGAEDRKLVNYVGSILVGETFDAHEEAEKLRQELHSAGLRI